MNKRVLILGGSGMLGSKLYKSLRSKYDIFATIRGNYRIIEKYGLFEPERVRDNVDALDFDSIVRAVAAFKPDVVINCIGLIKQLPASKDPLWAITINSQLPHRISLLCAASKIRFIHISTDCVFSGKKGNYTEDDLSDAEDLYGKTKFLGEVDYKPHTITLRTSIIGREISTRNGLVEWFLNTKDSVEGYKKAMFSGFTTDELAKIIREIVIPNEKLTGLYNVSANPISKYDLLNLIKKEYGLSIEIKENDTFAIDRILNSDKFRKETGYVPPSWEELIREMRASS